jgi:hypothetical protein
VLHPGRDVQQRLMHIESVAAFADIVAGIRQAGPPSGWREPEAEDLAVAVPRGPVERW